MALGGTIRGKKTTLRLPAEADLETYNRWLADMRVRRAHSVWQEPAMPATWKERLKETAKEKMDVLWSIDAERGLIGFAAGSFWSVTESGFTLRQFVIDPEEWRKGYGWDAALALHRYLFDYLDLRRAGVEVRADKAAGPRIAPREREVRIPANGSVSQILVPIGRVVRRMAGRSLSTYLPRSALNC